MTTVNLSIKRSHSPEATASIDAPKGKLVVHGPLLGRIVLSFWQHVQRKPGIVMIDAGGTNRETQFKKLPAPGRRLKVTLRGINFTIGHESDDK